MKDITNNYGNTIIKQYNNSYINLITNVYSNYNWLPWKFKCIPKNYWEDENNVKQYINWLSQKLNIETLEDWYKVSREVKSNIHIFIK